MNNCSSSPASVSETSWTEIGLVIGYLSILSVTGSIGNLLVLYVFARRKDALVSTLFILVLAEVDFITCLVVMPYTAYMEYVDFRTDVDLVCKFYLFLITFNIPFSALIMAAIAVDRYLCICHPFLRAMTIGRAKVLVAALGLFAAGQGLCVSLIYGVYLPYDDDCPMSQLSDSYPLVNTGHCQPNELVVSKEFQWYYQKLYTAMYPACLAAVIILYVLIYRSVLARRSRRQREKGKSLAPVQSLKTNRRHNSQTDDTLVPCLVEFELKKEASLNTGRCRLLNRNLNKMDANLLANLKTAAMLFVVTVIFVITFLPAFLMALQLVPYRAIIFYLYFANNVANPVIYSFMNKNFRADLNKFFGLRR